MNELQETEPPRLLSNYDRDMFLALLDSDPEPTEAAQMRLNGLIRGGMKAVSTTSRPRQKNGSNFYAAFDVCAGLF